MVLKTPALWLLTPTGLLMIWLMAFTHQIYIDTAWWALPFILTQVIIVCIGIGISMWATCTIIN